jgi:hypothetical protein
VGHRKMGLKYDDLISEEREDIQKVSSACARAVGMSLAELAVSRKCGTGWTMERRGPGSTLEKSRLSLL